MPPKPASSGAPRQHHQTQRLGSPVSRVPSNSKEAHSFPLTTEFSLPPGPPVIDGTAEGGSVVDVEDEDEHKSVSEADSEVEDEPPVDLDHDKDLDIRSSSLHSSGGSAGGDFSITASTTSGLGRLDGRSRRKKKGLCADIAPYFLSSSLAMFVPILFIMIVHIVALSLPAADLVLIDKTHDLVVAIPPCLVKHMNERDWIASYVTFGDHSIRAELDAARVEVDACRESLHRQLASLSKWRPSLFHQPLIQFADESSQLAVDRFRVNKRNTTGAREQESLSETIKHYADLVLRIDDELNLPSPHLARLHTVQTLAAYLGAVRGAGEVIALLNHNSRTSSRPSDTQRDDYIAPFSRALAALKESQSVAVPGFEAEWHHPTVATMWSMMELLRTEDGYVEIQKAPTEWWRNTTAGVSELTRYFLELQEKYGEDETVALLRDELIKLFAGVIICVVAAGLLGLHQMRLRNQMMKQIATLHEAKKAVSAFIPKSFLATMGYTSITQVTPGHCTETALTMLFADIRRFTTVAEGMGNTELFDWVQAYFARMTGVIESGHGQINMFIGDALFAVFKCSRDACLTGVAMHASVEQLNIANRCARNADRKVPVEIGVGIHQDCVALGVLGDEKRHTCTLISASVNLASRLEGLTKHLRCRIIISGGAVATLTAAQSDEVRYRSLGPAMVKGSGQSSTIFEVFMADDENLQNYKIASKDTFEALVKSFSSTEAVLSASVRDGLVKAADTAENIRSTQIAMTGGGSASPSPITTNLDIAAKTALKKRAGVTEDEPVPPLLNLIDAETAVMSSSHEVNGIGAHCTSDSGSSTSSSSLDVAHHRRHVEHAVSYQEAITTLLKCETTSREIRQMIRNLVEMQRAYSVTDETFYRLLMFHQGKAGMVFGNK